MADPQYIISLEAKLSRLQESIRRLAIAAGVEPRHIIALLAKRQPGHWTLQPIRPPESLRALIAERQKETP